MWRRKRNSRKEVNRFKGNKVPKLWFGCKNTPFIVVWPYKWFSYRVAIRLQCSEWKNNMAEQAMYIQGEKAHKSTHSIQWSHYLTMSHQLHKCGTSLCFQIYFHVSDSPLRTHTWRLWWSYKWWCLVPISMYEFHHDLELVESHNQQL